MADILSIGSSGLSAYRRSLEVTGNNIVNANTEGYARRDVQLQGLIEAGTTPTTLITGSGGGVAIDMIRRASDTFVQAEMRTASSLSAQATAIAERLDRLEKNLFSADTDLSASIQNFFGKIQDFASTPTSIPIRVTVLQAADALAADFRAQANKLTNEATAIFNDVDEQLNQTNALTSSIATLNKKLDSLGGDPSKVNDLLDQRDKLVDQLVKFVGVTVEARKSGAVNIYLGDSINGPKLVDETKSKPLSAAKVGIQVALTLDPYGRSIPIAKIEGGSVGGVLSFGDHVTSALNQLNRLATGFTALINKQHAQGLDLKGNFGLPFYTSYNLGVEVPNTNKGNATALLDLSNASSEKVSSKGYEARYDDEKKKWAITNLETQEIVNSGMTGSINGIKITFSGMPETGDTLSFSPLKDAAAGIRMLIQDPTQLAASLPQFAETGDGNTGSAEITLTGTQSDVLAPPIAQLDKIFNYSLSPVDAISFKSDAVIGTIPSGASKVSLISLANISAASFTPDPHALKQAGSTLTISLNGISKTITLPTEGDMRLSSEAMLDPMESLVERINKAFETETPPVNQKLFANRVGGSLIINALGTNIIDATPKPYFTFSLSDGTSQKIIAEEVETPVEAADLQILTREGRQVAGAMAPDTSIITTANGFSSDAALKSIDAYRNLLIQTTTSPFSTKERLATGQKLITDLGFAAGKKFSISIGGATAVEVLTVKASSGSLPEKTVGDLIAAINSNTTLNPAEGSVVASLGPTGQLVITVASGQSLTLSTDDTSAKLTPLVGGTSASVTSGAAEGANTYTGSLSRSARLSIDANSTTDGAWTSATKTSSVAAGSVYVLGIAGLPTIRLAGDTIAGKDSASIAETFEKRLHALAPSRLVVGEATTLSDALQSAKFTVTIDNKDHHIVFNRSFGADGTPLPGGVFQLTDKSDLKIDMVPAASDPTKQQVIISLPKKLGSNAPSLKITGSDASVFGLGSTATLRQRLIATQPTSISVADAATKLENDFGLTGPTVTKVDECLVVELALSSVSTTAQNLASLSANYAGAASKKALRDEAVSLGFLGTDLTLSRNQTNFLISSLATDDDAALLDTSSTVSRVAQKISVSTKNGVDPIPEDLIVSVKGSATGQRKILTDLPPTMVRSNPIFPDIEIAVIGADKIEIFDRIKNADGSVSRGASLGTRDFTSGKAVKFLGATFQLDGNSSVGDTYTITTALNRIGDNRNGLALAKLQQQDVLGPGSGTFQEIYQDEIGKIGASSQAAQTSAVSLKTVAQNLKTAFDSVTGVNLDSEAADLIKLQQAYSACAQIVSTARDMFNTILKTF